MLAPMHAAQQGDSAGAGKATPRSHTALHRRARPVWSQLGIEAKGRARVRKINYRNTAQILSFARHSAAEVIGAPGLAADEEDPVLLPEDGWPTE